MTVMSHETGGWIAKAATAATATGIAAISIGTIGTISMKIDDGGALLRV
jgi:hypothetical protein